MNFEAQVGRSQDALAAVFEDMQLTYLGLNQRANQLARLLQASGIGLEMAVGICLERSLDLLVAVLAILKSGGLYVPLDPAAPSERLILMIQDAGIHIVLTLHHLCQQLPVSIVPYFCLDTDWQQVAGEALEDRAYPIDPRNAAYILYTSGSTGVPKGVVVEHRQIVNYSEAIRTRATFTAPATYAMI